MSSKEEYVEKTKARLRQLDAELEKMEAKAREVAADAKIEWRRRIDDLRARRNDVDGQLQDLEKTGEDAWGDLRTGFESAWADLSDAFDKAKARFR